MWYAKFFKKIVDRLHFVLEIWKLQIQILRNVK